MIKPAILVLANGEVFHGVAIGAEGVICGEVVFNTAMTGYQEIITDPSYASQIVTLTYPHIGNTGINSEDMESEQVYAAGLVIRDKPFLASNWRKEKDISIYLIENNVVAIADIDTRRLTRILRNEGAQNGCIIAGINGNINKALQSAKDYPSMQGMDLAKTVTTKKTYNWSEAEWHLDSGYTQQCTANYHVVVYDFGVKKNILRMLAQRGCQLTIVSATTSADEVLKLQPDGVFLSNGPGDPEPCDYAILAIKELLAADMPLFGICLGHQLLALASGASTEKMKFGHHGANHPVKDLTNGNVLITSQNHGFAVAETSLPTCIRVTHKSLFDNSIQGIERNDKPAFSFQGHPEASPGPHDVAPLFDQFIELIERNAK